MTPDESSLAEHHRYLERRFQQLIAVVEAGDPISLRCEWLLFERELEEHLTLEERELFPALRRAEPAEAGKLAEEHRGIRRAVAEMAVALDLHLLRAEAVADFIASLRAHARREEKLLYPFSAAVGSQRLATVARALHALTGSVAAAEDVRPSV